MAPPKAVIAARNLPGLKQVEAARANRDGRSSDLKWENLTARIDPAPVPFEDQGIVLVRPKDGQDWSLVDNPQAER